MAANEYDLIIIGAGPSSAGLLRGILTRIKETDARMSIAVVERGESTYCDESSFNHQHKSTVHLQHWFDAAHYTSRPNGTDVLSPTVLYESVPQKHLNNRILDVPTGRGWGGGTNIHAGLFVHPCDDDFRSWPDQWKQRMKQSVDYVEGIFEKEGKLEHSNYKICELVAELNMAAFEPVRTSSVQSKRVNYYSVLVQSMFDEYPNLRQYVTFHSGMEVERILIGKNNESDWHKSDPTRAWGVECLVRKKCLNQTERRVVFKAKSQIILCAGAIGDPSILLASGIGHEDDLFAAGINPWYKHLSPDQQQSIDRNLAVGKNLRDHILMPRVFLTTSQQIERNMSYNSLRGWWTIKDMTGKCCHGGDEYAKYQIQLADGIAIDRMIPHFAAGPLRRGWYVSFLSWSLPNSLITFVFYTLRGLLYSVLSIIPGFIKWLRLHFICLNVCLMNPQSCGNVRLARRKNEISPSSTSRLSEFEIVIDPGYLSDPHDIHLLWKGWELTTTLKQRCNCLREICPGYVFVVLFRMVIVASNWLSWLSMLVFLEEKDRKFEGKTTIPSWFPGYVAEFAVPYYHWFGTCAIGSARADRHSYVESDSNCVVDESLCVHGVSGLRVCDASVFPGCMTVPTALTCAALGFASSTLIMENDS